MTQSLAVATKLCAMNDWQKIGPFPAATDPCRSMVKSWKMVPPNYEWVPIEWNCVLLTLVVLATYPQFRSEVEDDVLSWLQEGQTPTTALSDATVRAKKNMAHQERAAKMLGQTPQISS